MNSLDKIIFGKKTFSSLINEIYDNQKNKDKLIASLISELKPLISSIGDATLLVPLIKEYLEIGVKNDEQLVKLATIVQRIFQSTSDGGDGFNISDDEKDQLLKAINDVKGNETINDK